MSSVIPMEVAIQEGLDTRSPSSGTQVPVDRKDPRIGQNLGKYVITRRLGEGGMGVVYEARDTMLQREVAIKLLAAGLGSNLDSWWRFLREAQTTAKLNHANVVSIYEVDQQEGAGYFVMELMRGGSVQDALNKRGRFSWQEATRLIADACRGLQAAHESGLIHRDIKPANLMLSTENEAKLADFGLAKAAGNLSMGSTGAGQVVGTPNYMSPEQCRAEPTDHRGDVYSLGGTYYSLLTGQPPYRGDGPYQVMFAHCSHPVPDPRLVEPEVPLGCARVVMKAMAKQPADRYQSAGEMLADLERVLERPEESFRTAKVEPVVLGGRSGERVYPWALVAAVFMGVWALGGATMYLSARGNSPWAGYVGQASRPIVDASADDFRWSRGTMPIPEGEPLAPDHRPRFVPPSDGPGFDQSGPDLILPDRGEFRDPGEGSGPLPAKPNPRSEPPHRAAQPEYRPPPPVEKPPLRPDALHPPRDDRPAAPLPRTYLPPPPPSLGTQVMPGSNPGLIPMPPPPRPQFGPGSGFQPHPGPRPDFRSKPSGGVAQVGGPRKGR